MTTENLGADTGSSPTPEVHEGYSAEVEAMFRDDMPSEDVQSESSTDASEGDRDPSSSTEAEPGEKKAGEDDQGVPPKTAKRIEKLLGERGELREQQRNLTEKIEMQEAHYRLALKEAGRQLQALKQRLSQHEDLEAPEEELAAMRTRERVKGEVQKTRAELAQEFRQRAEAAREQEMEQHYAEVFQDTFDDVAKEFPHLPRTALREAILKYAEKNPDYPVTEAHKVFKEAAQDFESQLEKVYEARLLGKHKAKLGAPVTLPASGTVPVRNRPLTDEEIVAEINAKLGADYFRD